jgi:glycerophosphoryl diester phosphodiesterase
MIRLSHFAFDEKQWSSLDEVPFQLPFLQAHRGYWSSGQPQNSIASVQAAFDQNYDMTELDLRLTKDKHVVLFHDLQVLDTDQVFKISDLELRQLRDLLPVTTLVELFEKAPKKLLFNLEIKNETKTQFALEEQLIAFFRQHSDWKERILFSSFNPFSLSWMKLLAPEIPRALLVTQEKEYSFFLKEMSFLNLVKPHFINVRWEDLDHYKEIPPNRKSVWTLNDRSMAKTLYHDQKVASVITDEVLPSDFK